MKQERSKELKRLVAHVDNVIHGKVDDVDMMVSPGTITARYIEENISRRQKGCDARGEGLDEICERCFFAWGSGFGRNKISRRASNIPSSPLGACYAGGHSRDPRNDRF